VNSSGISVPSLSSSVLASPHSHVVSVRVSLIIWLQAESCMVNESSTIELNLLVWIISPWSQDNSIGLSMEVVELNTDSIVSSLVRSDRLGSVIKEPPLVFVEWLEVLDSKSILV